MPLQLTRPLAFIDLETTGVNLAIDRIVEIAIVKILPDGSRQVKENGISVACLLRLQDIHQLHK